MSAILTGAVLGLLWLAVIVLASAWPEEPRHNKPRKPREIVSVCAGAYTRLELQIDGEHTDWLLTTAARILDGIQEIAADSAEQLLDRACLVLGYADAGAR